MFLLPILIGGARNDPIHGFIPVSKARQYPLSRWPGFLFFRKFNIVNMPQNTFQASFPTFAVFLVALVVDFQGVIAEVVSFLDPQAVLSYALACKAAEEALWQVSCRHE